MMGRLNLHKLAQALPDHLPPGWAVTGTYGLPYGMSDPVAILSHTDGPRVRIARDHGILSVEFSGKPWCKDSRPEPDTQQEAIEWIADEFLPDCLAAHAERAERVESAAQLARLLNTPHGDDSAQAAIFKRGGIDYLTAAPPHGPDMVVWDLRLTPQLSAQLAQWLADNAPAH